MLPARATGAWLSRLARPFSNLARGSLPYVVGQPCAATHPDTLTPEELVPGILASEYASRRARLAAKLPPNSLAVVSSSPVAYMAGVVPYPYRPSPDLSYLTGIQQPGVVALLTPDARLRLLVPGRDPVRALWDGAGVDAEAGVAVFGAHEAWPASQGVSELAALLREAAFPSRGGGGVFCDDPALGGALGEDWTGAALTLERCLEGGFPAGGGLSASLSRYFQGGGADGDGREGTADSRRFETAPLLRPLAPHLHAMRWVKSPAEVRLMARAAEATAAAMRVCMGMHARAARGEERLWAALGQGADGGRAGERGSRTWKGEGSNRGAESNSVAPLSRPVILREAHVAARFQAECLLRGSNRLAYPSVVAGGADACTIHYSRNDKALAEGDLLLMDAGCEAQGYASDVTRTWPVNGTWASEQRAVYEAVLRAHARCLSMVRPGETLRRIHAASVDSLVQELAELGLLSRTLGHGLGSRESYRDFYPHSVGHWLGMDTHDVPNVAHDTPLEPGVVLTIEPGIYVPRAGGRHGALEGIGVRIEDVVAVTESGCDVLSGGLPVCPDDVADLVRNG